MNFKLQKYAPKKGYNRKPGECSRLLNTTPMRVSGSEVTRYGYSSAGLPTLDGAATGLTSPIYKYASTEKPSAQEVLFAFGQLSAADAFLMRPWIKQGTSTFDDSWVLLDEQATTTLNGTPSADAFTAVLTAGSAVDDYYNGWIIKNTTQNEYAYITDYVGSTKTITCVEKLGSNGLSWANTNAVTLQRWFHDQLGIDPQYDFPIVNAISGDFRVGGGKGSNVGNKDLWVGYINRTFFPTESETFTYQGQYASLREVRVPYPSGDVNFSFTDAAISGNEVALDTGYTYFFAMSAVYDGFQISPYVPIAGQYLTTASRKIVTTITIPAGRLNKRITGYRIYVAQVQGDASATLASFKNLNFRFLREISLVNTDETGWSYTASTTQRFTHTYNVDKTEFNKMGSSWAQDSGYVYGGFDLGTYAILTDTTYSHDLEISQGNRQFIGRVYKYTDAKEDLDVVYTNPRSGDGLIQPDIFSDEPDVFTNRVLWGDSSFLTSIIPTERGTILALKDRAVVEVSWNENPDGTLNFFSTIISTQVGCVSKTGAVSTPFGQFFAGYDDIYWYTGSRQLIPLTVEDWEDVYRAISTANKLVAILWFRVEDSGVYVQFGSTAIDSSNNDSYTYFITEKTWRQVTYADTIAYYTVKRDNTVVWTKSDGTAYKFDTSADDAGTAIAPQWRTGYFKTFPSGVKGNLIRVHVNKHQVVSAGTLDCKLLTSYNGTVVTTTISDVDQSLTRLRLSIPFAVNGLFDFVDIQYNENASPETGLVEFGEIEVDAIEEVKHAQV